MPGTRIPPSRGSPPTAATRGTHTHTDAAAPSTLPTKFLQIQDSLEAFEEEEEPYSPPLGWEEEERGEKSVFKSNFIFFYPRQVMPHLDWGLLLGSFKNLLLSM